MNIIYTVGHSTRTIEEFIEILSDYSVETVVDVRRWPTSKKHPHYCIDSLRENLLRVGIRYRWMGENLGGYVKNGLGDESPNMGWKSRGFRNYADYAMTQRFRAGLDEVASIGFNETVACMCAERFYWRCHRRILSDYLTIRGFKVIHIVDSGKTVEHTLPEYAAVKGDVIVYRDKVRGVFLADSFGLRQASTS
ncbi:MAG: DUF488 domain-containing protein [Candidatus Bathyarchaeia archaeon]|nr:DUF488 domain-containing protein [Candidatus Bathyarchaeota archaeon]